MPNTNPNEFSKGYGDKAYEHAKPGFHGESSENWTLETDAVNAKRQEEYGKRLDVFKTKHGLQEAAALKNVGTEYTFTAGDTLYPFLTSPDNGYGMNEHTAFLVMTRLLSCGVNVDKWSAGDTICLSADGTVSGKRGGADYKVTEALVPVAPASGAAPQGAPPSGAGSQAPTGAPQGAAPQSGPTAGPSGAPRGASPQAPAQPAPRVTPVSGPGGGLAPAPLAGQPTPAAPAQPGGAPAAQPPPQAAPLPAQPGAALPAVPQAPVPAPAPAAIEAAQDPVNANLDALTSKYAAVGLDFYTSSSPEWVKIHEGGRAPVPNVATRRELLLGINVADSHAKNFGGQILARPVKRFFVIADLRTEQSKQQIDQHIQKVIDWAHSPNPDPAQMPDGLYFMDDEVPRPVVPPPLPPPGPRPGPQVRPTAETDRIRATSDALKALFPASPQSQLACDAANNCRFSVNKIDPITRQNIAVPQQGTIEFSGTEPNKFIFKTKIDGADSSISVDLGAVRTKDEINKYLKDAIARREDKITLDKLRALNSAAPAGATIIFPAEPYARVREPFALTVKTGDVTAGDAVGLADVIELNKIRFTINRGSRSGVTVDLNLNSSLQQIKDAVIAAKNQQS